MTFLYRRPPPSPLSWTGDQIGALGRERTKVHQGIRSTYKPYRALQAHPLAAATWHTRALARSSSMPRSVPRSCISQFPVRYESDTPLAVFAVPPATIRQNPLPPQSWLLSAASQSRVTGMHLECHGMCTGCAWEVHGKCNPATGKTADFSFGARGRMMLPLPPTAQRKEP